MTVDHELIKQIKITPLLDTLKLENISDEEYFSEYRKDYISNSRLGILKKDGVEVKSLDCKSSFMQLGLFSLIFLLL
jgi:hypothetical protein